MSDLWGADVAGEAMRVDAWAKPKQTAHFQPWGDVGHPMRRASDFAPCNAHGNDEPPPEPAIDPDALAAEAFAEGFEQGRLAVAAEYARERQALAALVRSAEALQPEPHGPLAALLTESVTRLVRQIVGEVQIDAAMLRTRAAAIAELITAESGPARLRLNPDDIALLEGVDLGLPVAPDHHLPSGTIVLETGEGWIEDGPQVRLARLRQQLDSMVLPS